MLRIAVTIRDVPDVKAPLEINTEGNGLWEDGICYELNADDLEAVRQGILLKQQLGDAEVYVVAAGTSRLEGLLRECLALGADQAILVPTTQANKRYGLLTSAIIEMEPDLVLCGTLSVDSNECSLAPLFAEKMNVPVVQNVVSLELGEGNTIVVQRAKEQGLRDVIRLSYPAVIGTKAGVKKTEYPSLPSYLAALCQEVTLETNIRAPFERSGSVRLVSLDAPKPRTKKVIDFDAGLSAEERLNLLTSGGISQKQGNIVQGDKKLLAERWMHYLVHVVRLNPVQLPTVTDA